MDNLPDPFASDASIPSPPQLPATLRIAPAWHTIVLIAGILALSIVGALRPAVLHGSANRLMTYGTTAVLELFLLGWVALGLRLKKIPLRLLFGAVPGDFRSIAQDMRIALVFWIGSLMILATLGIIWSRVETVVTQRQPANLAGRSFAPSDSEQRTVRELAQLAPANGEEITGWVLLCILAGIVEELVSRGYLQRQFTAWAQGGAAVGLVFSALLFGAAHGYQGVRNMVLLSVFGALFSLLAIFRRSLRSCIFAHCWHDLIAGLALGLLRTHHLL